MSAEDTRKRAQREEEDARELEQMIAQSEDSHNSNIRSFQQKADEHAKLASNYRAKGDQSAASSEEQKAQQAQAESQKLQAKYDSETNAMRSRVTERRNAARSYLDQAAQEQKKEEETERKRIEEAKKSGKLKQVEKIARYLQ